MTSQAEPILIIVKNPARPESTAQSIKVDTSVTVLQVKKLLQEHYEGKPDISQQRLIYAGKLLKDNNLVLRDVLKGLDVRSEHTFHLVIKGEKLASSGSSAAAGSVPSTQAAGLNTSQLEVPGHRLAEPSASDLSNLSIPSQQSIPQARSASSSWPAAAGDPTIQAAYNAALESLRSRPATSSTQNLLPAISYPPAPLGWRTPDIAPPTFSVAPTLLLPPTVASNQISGSVTLSQQGGSVAILSREQASMPPALPQGLLQPGIQSHLPQLYAPTLAYLPVSMAQNMEEGGVRQTGPPQEAPAAGQLLPMMMPLGFNPFAPPLLAPHQLQGNPPPLYLRPQIPPPANPAPQPPGQGPQPGRQHNGIGLPVHGRAQPAPVVNVRVFRVNLKAILQFCVVAFLVYQSAPFTTSIRLIGVAALAYFLWPLLNRNNALGRRVQQAIQPWNADVAVQENAAAINAAPQNRGGWLVELQTLVLGFLASLLPGFNMNAEDAAAFAAAQRIIDQEAAGQRQQAIAREHQD